jgi:hypothetical protein
MSALTLSPFAKSLFLRHRVAKSVNNKYHEYYPISEIFKCLVSYSPISKVISDNFQLISRQFLRASQLYRVYYFVVYEVISNDEYSVFLSNRNFMGAGTDRIILSVADIRGLNQLLNVQYFQLVCFNTKDAAKYAKLCQFFKGLL